MGTKLASTVGSSVTYYRSVMIYAKNGTAAQQLLYMLQPEGLVAKEGTAWVYKYQKKDHLGNSRALLAVRNNTLVNEGQNTDYYPYGVAHSVNNLNLNRYLFGGKEMQDASLGGSMLGYYDFGARFYNPMYGRWFNMDPAKQFENPFTYCGNNPIVFIDPNGKWSEDYNGYELYDEEGNFYNENGVYLGTDGIDDGRIYIVKTTKKRFGEGDYQVPGAYISKKEWDATVDFIKKNSGNITAFKAGDIAYRNTVEIEGSQENRQAMVKEISKDNGKGGIAPENNREYGGSIMNGTVVLVDPGKVSDPAEKNYVSIQLHVGVVTFHSHPSVMQTNEAGYSSPRFRQHPSREDIKNGGNYTEYVFGRADGKVYIFNSMGVQAVMPMAKFVNLKR